MPENAIAEMVSTTREDGPIEIDFYEYSKNLEHDGH